MQTLEQLRRGELHGITRLTLSENLTEFPEQIYDLADSLEVLDLSGNQLVELPADLYRLNNLKILFCSDNCFTRLPDVLGACPKLEMIGFKHNQISLVPSDSLPKQTRWLILTDNQIEALPDSIGELSRLQKLALAGNRLTRLPASIAHCKKLELVRLSANQLTEFPDVLLDLPRLAWLAFAGNPFCAQPEANRHFPMVSPDNLTLHSILGQGASGVISSASWKEGVEEFPEQVAVKVFKGDVTSDGYPEDELDACLIAGTHDNLVKPLAQIHQNDRLALVMELIPQSYVNLGQPPSLASCTRDTFTQGQRFSVDEVVHMVAQLDSLVEHLHVKGISHGDIYAHNALIGPDTHLLFGDFGAASRFDNLESYQQQAIRVIERRAVNCFVEDLLSLCPLEERDHPSYQKLLDRLGEA